MPPRQKHAACSKDMQRLGAPEAAWPSIVIGWLYTNR
eukprot:CAMPEP_0206419538 /NCGR_PEP_ID=MMETSP0324_2-20121206/200_1 /ASSEMBLY_ACC=CAM_ASM_000836 /TAXON_ID=2866 /ORGANISM="Crypthecodinium cohnii, Strain Seligo" /LENGTH=36 /DNA_ID= /DNA_START= /DNA_END= /DNA_ORIENTATION=